MQEQKLEVSAKERDFLMELVEEYGDMVFGFELALTLNTEKAKTITINIFSNLISQVSKMKNLSYEKRRIVLLKETYITYLNLDNKKTDINLPKELSQVLPHLSLDERTVYFLSDVLGLNFEEIATITSKSKEEVMRLVSKARFILLDKLSYFSAGQNLSM